MPVLGAALLGSLALVVIVSSFLHWMGLQVTSDKTSGTPGTVEHLLNNAFDVFLLLDENLTVVESSESTREFLGFSAEELHGMRVDDFLETHSYHELESFVNSSNTDEQVKFSDYLARSLNPPLPVEIKLISGDERGSSQDWYFVGRDLRNEIELEENLLKREEQFRQLARNLDAVFWMRDTDGNALYVSSQYENIWERSLQAFEEDVNAYTEAIIDEDYERVKEAIPEMETGEYDIEYRIETPDGTRKWIHDRAFPIRDPDGEVYRIGGIAEDITRRKENQKQIEFQRELLEVILETSNEGVLAINKDREIIAFNDRFQEIWELPDEVFENETDDEALELAEERVANPEEFRRTVENAYESPNDRIVDELHFDDGRIIKQYSRTMNYDGEYQGRVWYFQDITEGRKVRSQLEESLKEKEMLLQEIHHRVKNNMQVISSMLNLQFGQFDDEEVQEHVSDTLNRIQSMAITHEMLYQSDNFGTLDLSAYLRQLCQHLFSIHSGEVKKVAAAIEIGDVEITLKQAISCGLIVTELISNSLQHGFEEDETGTIEVLFNQDEHGSELVIRDDGQGLPNDFDPRSSDSLGLQLVDTLVESSLEGEYDIRSRDGTEVRIRFELDTLPV